MLCCQLVWDATPGKLQARPAKNHPDSHFSSQKPIYIIGDTRPKTQDSRRRILSSICNPVSWVLRLESWVLSLNNSDYSHYLVWIAKPFNTNVLQHFHQEKMITSITYSTANDYYIHYLQRNRKTCRLRPDNRKPRSGDYLTNEFHQVIKQHHSCLVCLPVLCYRHSWHNIC